MGAEEEVELEDEKATAPFRSGRELFFLSSPNGFLGLSRVIVLCKWGSYWHGCNETEDWRP